MKVRLKVKSLGGAGGIVTTTLTITDKVAGRDGGRTSGSVRGEVGSEGVSVDAAMEAEAVKTFLAQGDPARLGRALAAVYRAMERVRRAELGEG